MEWLYEDYDYTGEIWYTDAKSAYEESKEEN